MKVRIFLPVLLFTVFGCQSENTETATSYPNQFGEIYFDAAIDNPAFALCDSSSLEHSRTSLSYKGGRQQIATLCKAALEASNQSFDFNGYVVIRFLVNCDGQVGRLRVEALDDGFVPKDAPDALISTLKQTVGQLNEWTITKPANEGKDHSKYMNFKIRNGQIDAIIH